MRTTAVMTTTAIRAATEADIATMVAMGQRFRNESVYAARLAENPDQMAAHGRMLLASDDGLLLVAARDGEVVGMIGALIFVHHLSGALTAAESFFWVNPDARGCGVRLLRAFERWARTRGATTVQMIAPTPEVEQLYARLGYAPLEVAYTKELTSCP